MQEANQILIDNKVDPEEFARILNLNERAGEALAKEMVRTGRKKRELFDVSRLDMSQH